MQDFYINISTLTMIPLTRFSVERNAETVCLPSAYIAPMIHKHIQCQNSLQFIQLIYSHKQAK